MNRAVIRLTRAAAGLFYRLRELGEEVPAEGPLLLVGNHPNGLVDPVLVASRTHREVRFLGKAPLFALPVLGRIMRRMRALPVYRAVDGADTQQNERTFAAVYEALLEGSVVCLFPEGYTHDEPSLQRLKTGAARMALGAEAQANFELGVRVVPVGLVFRNKGVYRSSAASWVGASIPVSDLREAHAADPFAAAQELTDRVARGLRAVTLNLEQWEDLPLLELAERLWPRGGGDPGDPGGPRVQRLHALARGLRALRARDPERARDLVARVSDFRGRLRRLGIDVDDLRIEYGPGLVARFVIKNLLALGLGLPAALLGFALWLVPYYLVRLVVSVRRIEDSVVATVKLIASILFFPLWYAVLVYLGLRLGGVPGAAALALLAPPLGLFTAGFWEKRAEAVEDAAVFFRMLRARSLRERLQRRRRALEAEIEATSRLLVQEPAPGRGAGAP